MMFFSSGIVSIYKCFSDRNLMDCLTSFPAALQMALCSLIFAVSSLYSSIASMILSAYTDDGKGQKSSQQTHHPTTLQMEGLTKSYQMKLLESV